METSIGRLAPAHRRELVEESGISPELVEARGYWTATDKAELKALGFAEYQARTPALVLPMYGPNGGLATHQIKPNAPRRDKKNKPIKYETPMGSGIRLDVHPSYNGRTQDTAEPLWIVEGVEKADAANSRGLTTVVLQGVDCIGKNNDAGVWHPLPEWELIPLHGRTVYVCFDSDVNTKSSVQRALAKLREFLQGRGAVPKIVYLPDGEDGAKVGLDDYLAAGGTVEDLERLADAPKTKPEPSYEALTDVGVLELARACKTTGRVFVKLYDHGDTSGYPSRSEAHYNLCQLLAYWTIKDAGQIERLFWESKLAETVERSNRQTYVRKTVQSGIKNQLRTYRTGLRPPAKDRVRELAQRHLEWIAGLDWSYRGGETDHAVNTDVTRHAGEWAYPADDGALDFNVNQQSIADRVGLSQWTVSKSLQRLREKGLLIRLSKGHTGRNSYYRLPLPSAETTTMKQPPCVVHSSGEANTRLPLHSSGGSSDSEPEPLPEENPEPDGLPEIEDTPEIEEDGWETVG